MKNQNNKVCECLETGSHLALLPAAEHGPTHFCLYDACVCGAQLNVALSDG